MKLNVKALSLAAGIILAVVTFIITVWNSFTEFAEPLVAFMEEIYVNIVQVENGAGFLQNTGGILGLSLFSFIDGSIIGLGFGLMYNLLLPSNKSAENKKKNQKVEENV